MSNRVPYESGTVQCAIRQRSNPIVQCVTHTRISFVDIIPDFRIGSKLCMYFCSVAYHRRNPDALEKRLKDSKFEILRYPVKILIIHVNLDNSERDIETLTKIGFLFGFTVMVGWTSEECARILEYYVIHENRSVDLIQGKVANEHTARAIQLLTKIPAINSTDAQTILLEMESVKNITNSSATQLKSLSGIGDIKSENLWKVMNVPFRKDTEKV